MIVEQNVKVIGVGENQQTHLYVIQPVHLVERMHPRPANVVMNANIILPPSDAKLKQLHLHHQHPHPHVMIILPVQPVHLQDVPGVNQNLHACHFRIVL